MITIMALYRAGDRDNHRCGLKVAVCNLFNDAARREGHDVKYVYGLREKDDTALVVYSADVPTIDAAMRLLGACCARGIDPLGQLACVADKDEEVEYLKQAGYHPARRT